MSVSDGFRDFVVDQLRDLDFLSTKRMFGAVGLFYEGLIFGLLVDDVLFLKVDDSNRADYVQAGMMQLKPYADKPMQMPYYEVPADVLENRQKLLEWVKKAHLASQRRPPKRKKVPPL